MKVLFPLSPVPEELEEENDEFVNVAGFQRVSFNQILFITSVSLHAALIDKCSIETFLGFFRGSCS